MSPIRPAEPSSWGCRSPVLPSMARTALTCGARSWHRICTVRAAGSRASRRDHADRVLTDVPLAGHPVLLHVAVPRMICENTGCDRVIFRAAIEHIAGPREVVTTRKVDSAADRDQQVERVRGRGHARVGLEDRQSDRGVSGARAGLQRQAPRPGPPPRCRRTQMETRSRTRRSELRHRADRPDTGRRGHRTGQADRHDRRP